MRTNLGLTKLKNMIDVVLPAGHRELSSKNYKNLYEKQACSEYFQKLGKLYDASEPSVYANRQTYPIVNMFFDTIDKISNIVDGPQGQGSLLKALKSTEAKAAINDFLQKLNKHSCKDEIIDNLCEHDMILQQPENVQLLLQAQKLLKLLLPDVKVKDLEKFNAAMDMPTIPIIEELGKRVG